jgi:hypothetical protein
MVTLRRGLEMMQSPSEQHTAETPTVQPPQKMKFPGSSGPLQNNAGNPAPRNSLIRRPIQTYVDADTNK